MSSTQIRRADVTVFTPMVTPSSHPLTQEIVTIGRASECAIPIKDRYLSRRHAELHLLDGRWFVRDCGSANGTYVNGTRVDREQPLKSGDRIRLGDTEILFHSEFSTDRFVAIADSRISPTIAIPIHEITDRPEDDAAKSADRLRILNALAIELIEDRPLDQLFGFIVDRIMDHLRPSRAAIGLLTDNGKSLASVEVRRQNPGDTSELFISNTLLTEIVEEKKALAFIDVMIDEKLSRAKSIIAQGIHSVLCAPLLVQGTVVGVLYVDYFQAQKALSEEDVRLIGQIARFAAVKIENTRLREDALQKRLIDEELKTAYTIQRRLLPATPPTLSGFSFSAINKPCRTVSGDYYDFVVRPDGSVYFVIADVSGKGITAALLMAGLQTAFRIFAKEDPAPAQLVHQLNVLLKENLPQSKFVTLFVGRVNTSNGAVEYTNAGHTPPVLLTSTGARELAETDLLLGMFPKAQYSTRSVSLRMGDSLVLFTDGLTEAENADGEELGTGRLAKSLVAMHGSDAAAIAEEVQKIVFSHTAEHSLEDDFTLLVLSRNA